MRRGPNKPCWPFTLNRGSSQARGLIGWWPGGPVGSPFLLDLSGKSRNGTLATTSGAVPGWAFGKDGGGCVSFAGSTGNRITFGNNTVLTGNVPVSTSVWLWSSVAPVAPGEVICNFGTDSLNQEVFTARLTGGQFYSEFGAGAGAVTGTTVMTLRRWYHLVSVYTTTTHTIYVNGVQDGTAAYSAANLGTNQFSWGSYLNFATYVLPLAGRLDDMRIYNRALSANEVLDIYTDPWDLRWQPSATIIARSGGIALLGGPSPYHVRRARAMSSFPMEMH